MDAFEWRSFIADDAGYGNNTRTLQDLLLAQQRERVCSAKKQKQWSAAVVRVFRVVRDKTSALVALNVGARA
jgi:hypothetical protein